MNTLDKDFVAIWCRAKNLPSLDSLTPELIKSWANERKLNIEDIVECDVGAFEKIKSIVLKVTGGRACFPKVDFKNDSVWKQRRYFADKIAVLWEKMEWFSPLWVPNGVVSKLLEETANCSKERAIELFDYHTSTTYTLAFQAVCIAQIMPQAHSLREFCPLAREAYLAFYVNVR